MAKQTNRRSGGSSAASAKGGAGAGRSRGGAEGEGRHAGWTLLSNHAYVLIVLARDPESRLRDVATSVGITERAVQKIITDLEDAGFITRIREGRRNRYEIHMEANMRHPLQAHRTIGHLLTMAVDPRDLRAAHGGRSGARKGSGRG